MRSLIIFAMLAAAPEWQTYTYPDMAMTVDFPAAPKVEPTTYKTADGMSLPGTLYSLSQDGNLYRIAVIDLSSIKSTKAEIIKHEVESFRAKGKIVEDTFARIGTEFGRNLNVAMNDGTRDVLSIYFTRNRKLYIIEGVALPGTTNAYALRFKESISFVNAAPAGPRGRGGAGAPD